MIVVYCHTCQERLVTVPTVARAERALWDHIDATGHDVERWAAAEVAPSERMSA